MTGTSTPEKARPVRLQINSTGAWRNVIDFNGSDPLAQVAVEDSAPVLARVGNALLRIVTADGLQQVLRDWTDAKGWRNWNDRGGKA